MDPEIECHHMNEASRRARRACRVEDISESKADNMTHPHKGISAESFSGTPVPLYSRRTTWGKRK